MDPALLRERELFKKRALALPTIEKRKAKDDGGANRPTKKPKPKPPSQPSDYKSLPGTSQYKFGVLAKIVKHMKQRHMDGDLHPLNIDEILDETNQLDIGTKQKHWLVTEALISNPKIDVIEGECYKYKPKYNIRDRKGLLRLLDKHDQRGSGGILMEDIEESLPNAQKAFRILGDSIIYVTRPIDKKKVLFYNDKSYAFKVDEDIAKLWRSAAVDGVDENKIEEYLERQGITSMSDIAAKRVNIQKRKKTTKKRNRTFKSHNDHMTGVLQDYSKD